MVQIYIDSIAGDNLLNAADEHSPLTAIIKGHFEGDVNNSVTTVNVYVNGKIFSATPQADGSFTAYIKYSDLFANDIVNNVGYVGAKAFGTSTTITYASTKAPYTIDTVAPSEPGTQIALDNIAGDNIINIAESQVAKTTISGKVSGEFTVGDTVIVKVNGTEHQVKAQADGSFSLEVNTSELLGGSEVSATVKATDKAGNVGEISTTQAYSVDTVAPSSPTTSIAVNAIAVDDIINAEEAKADTIDVQGSVSGEYRDGDTVSVVANGVVYKTVVKAGGVFSVAVKTADLIAVSKVTATVDATDAAGNVGQVSTTHSYTVDTGAPTVAVSLSDNSLAIGDTTQVTFSFSEAVKNFDLGDVTTTNGKLSGLMTVDGGKTWTATFTPNNNVESTTNVIEVADKSYQDLNGNDGKSGKSAAFVIDTIAPDEGVLSAPDGTTDTTPLITGTGTEAGANVVVKIYDKSDNLVETLTTTVDANGEYSVEMTKELSIGNYTAKATITDAAGNATTITDKGDVIAPGFHHKVWTVASSWGASHGPVDYASFKTGAGDDWLQVGNGAKNCWTYAAQGNLWNKNPCKGWAIVSTGAGDDRLDLGVSGGWGSQFSYTAVDMGSGDDAYNVKGSIHGNARVTMGSGNDTLVVGDDIDGCATVSMGTGNDNVHVKEDIENKAVVNLGSGQNTIHVERHVEDCAKIIAGEAEGNSTPNNPPSTKSAFSTASASAEGTTVMIDGSLKNFAQVILGDSQDTAVIGRVENYAKITMGAGDDTLTVKEAFGCGNPIADMGEGNDTFVYGGKTLGGKIIGGQGTDTIVLNYDADNSLVSKWCNITNLSSKNFQGIEVVDMQGTNAVDIRYSDLLNDTTNESPLFIKGDSNDKVDLGANNWNSDGASRANLKDNSTKWWDCNMGWSKTGSKAVDGVTYDVYHHSAAGSDTTNDVYIQQGVVVI